MRQFDTPLISTRAIEKRLKSLAAEITQFHQGKPFTVLGLLNGSIFFLVDLVRMLPLETQLECWRVQSYFGAKSRGKLQGLKHCHAELQGRHVVLIDDILDTGLTLDAVRHHALELGAAEVEICVLLRKNRPRKIEPPVRWVGFDIADEFVVGYGLDFNGAYRGLRAIHALPA
jgi:hypoxanthine phosphoribosyltransferase